MLQGNPPIGYGFIFCYVLKAYRPINSSRKRIIQTKLVLITYLQGTSTCILFSLHIHYLQYDFSTSKSMFFFLDLKNCDFFKKTELLKFNCFIFHQ